MKNKEKFAKEIIEIACSGDKIAMCDEKLTRCSAISCDACDFRSSVNGGRNCNENTKEWAESEYEEPKIQPEVKNCKVDDRILVSNDRRVWVERHFAKYDAGLDKVFAWAEGKTSWTTVMTYNWKYAKLPESEVQE